MPGQAELNLTSSVFLSSGVTLSKSFKFSELQGAPGSNGDKNFNLPEDLQKPPGKIFSNASSLHPVGISGVGCSPPHPDQDTGNCCSGLLHGIYG